MGRCHLPTFALLIGCAGGPPAPELIDVPDTCRALVDADPANWPEHWRAVCAIGPEAAPALVRALQERPEAPGAQAGLMMLGRLGGETARRHLESVLIGGGIHASEAALALGRVGNAESIPLLRAAFGAREKPPILRVAAAAGLIELGEGESVAPFVEAVFLAATPNGVLTSRREGLPPDKTRWAHERLLLIQSIQRRYGDTLGLDEDAPWPALSEAAAAVRARLAAGN